MEPIHVTLYYDSKLQKITGVDKESIVVSSNTLFLFLLDTIFTSYPQIPKTFPEGSLGMLLNNEPPDEYDVLHEGDEVLLLTELK